MIGAIGVSGEVAPRNEHCRAEQPGIGPWIVDVDFVYWRGEFPAQHPHLPIEVQATRIARNPRYAGDSADGIGHWVIDKRVCSIYQTAWEVVATTRVDEIANGRSRYIAAWYWQVRAFLHPGSGRSKLPNGISHTYVNVEPTKNVQLV